MRRFDAFIELFRLWHGWMIENDWADQPIELGDGRYFTTERGQSPSTLRIVFDLGRGRSGVTRCDNEKGHTYQWIGSPVLETDLIEIALLF